MVRGCGTIYKTSRNNTQLTQEQAAELLSVSIDSLKNYEGGRCKPDDSMVLKMVEIYDDKMLGYEHLRTSPLGKEILPELDVSALGTAALKYQRAMTKAQDMNNQLVDIACDNKVDAAEANMWDNLCGTAKNLLGAAMSLIMFPTTKNRQRGNADDLSKAKNTNKLNIPRLRRQSKGVRA